MKEKIILMILNQKFLPDIRVEKEIKTLKNYGYRIIVLASEKGEDDSKYEIIRLKSLSEYKTKILSEFFKVSNKLKKEIINNLNEKCIKNIDYIHVHDLYWGFLGAYLSKKFNSKLILDFHENYPYAYQQWKKYENNPIKKFVKSFNTLNKLKKYEIKMVKKANKTILVVNEAEKRFKGKIPQNKFEVISNTEEPNKWKYTKIKEIKKNLNITYVGGVGPHRGIDTIIKGFNYLSNRYKLNIVGINKKDPYYEVIKKLKNENKNKKNINFVSWIPFNEVQEYINNSHICLVPHNKNEHTETTIPHKLFQYMAMKRPILVSDVTPLKRIIMDTNAGEFFKADDALDFANKIREMDNFDKLLEWGENGRKAVEGKYNWTNDAKILINLYKELDNE